MSRKIRVAACSMVANIGNTENHGPISQEHRFEEIRQLLKDSAELGAKWACLPEWLGSWMTSHPPKDQLMAAEGTQDAHILIRPQLMRKRLGDWAKEFDLNLVCSYVTQHADGLRNTGILIDRGGKTAGEYYKVHLPDEERRWTQAGQTYPVFELEGVKVGIQLCYDLNYPEGCRALALQGADIVFWPHIWRNTTPQCEIIARTRAIENMFFICGSSYVCASEKGQPIARQPHRGLTAIIGWDGFMLAHASGAPSVAVAQLDLDQMRSWQASRQEMLFEHRRPDTYGLLTDTSFSNIKKNNHTDTGGKEAGDE